MVLVPFSFGSTMTVSNDWCITKKSKHIPFLGGRPYRNQPITPDEEIDLVIDLETTEDVADFLERVNG